MIYFNLCIPYLLILIATFPVTEGNLLKAFQDGSEVDAASFLLSNLDTSIDTNSIRDDDGMSLLHLACRWDWSRWRFVIKSLVEQYQCDISTVNEDMDTPLHVASRFNNTGAVRYFLSLESCDPNGRNIYGLTPLDIANEKQHSDVIEELSKMAENSSVDKNRLLQAFQSGHDFDAYAEILTIDPMANLSSIRDDDGMSLLHLACRWDWSRWGVVIRLLVEEHQCDDISMVDEDGNTPLHVASKFNNAGAVRYLLSLEACDPNAKNRAGLTPLLIAHEKQHNDVLWTLLSCSETVGIDSSLFTTQVPVTCAVSDEEQICDEDVTRDTGTCVCLLHILY